MSSSKQNKQIRFLREEVNEIVFSRSLLLVVNCMQVYYEREGSEAAGGKGQQG